MLVVANAPSRQVGTKLPMLANSNADPVINIEEPEFDVIVLALKNTNPPPTSFLSGI